MDFHSAQINIMAFENQDHVFQKTFTNKLTLNNQVRMSWCTTNIDMNPGMAYINTTNEGCE